MARKSLLNAYRGYCEVAASCMSIGEKLVYLLRMAIFVIDSKEVRGI